MSDFDFKLLSLNVRGLNDNNKRHAVFRWLKRQEADIIFLQETYTNHVDEQKWERDWGNKCIFVHGSKHSCGLMILFQNSLDINIKEVKKDKNGRFIFLTASIQETNFHLLNLYAPNKSNEKFTFFQNLKTFLLSQNIMKDEYLVVGGDFNVTLNTKLDKKGGIQDQKNKSKECIMSIIDMFDLQDIWRIQHPNTRRYTWRQKTPLIQCRLDYWLISDTLQDFTEKTSIITPVRSDHSAILIHFKNLKDENRGSNYWKFNNSLIADKEYVEFVKQNINDWAMSELEDKRTVWEIMKYYIRKHTIDYCKQKKRRTIDTENLLQKALEEVDTDLATHPSEALSKRREELCREIRQIENVKIAGAAIRSKVKWFEEGEKSSKFFFSLEKKNAIKTYVRKLQNLEGKFICDQQKILAMQKDYYEKLYSEKPIQLSEKHIQTFLNINDSILTQEEKDN